VIIDEIKEILEKNGFDTNLETISRVEIMLESIRDDYQLHKLDYIIDWFEKKREQSDMIVEQVGINDLGKWNGDKESGNISHDSKGFFEIIGISFGPDKDDKMRIRVSNAFDEFYDLRLKTEEEIVKFSRELKIDIAID